PGRIKEKIQTLPPAAQKQALEWLQRMGIPEEDYSTIDVDADGGVYYVEPVVSATEMATAADEPVTSESLSLQEAFSLHSKPGASRVIYLDFDGHTIEGTAWNSSVATYEAVPYDRDGALYSFSQSELADIARVWHRVAENFAAFDVDVTTEAPSQMGPDVGRILVTRSTDASGQAMPASNAGGVAYVGVWGRSNYPYYQPALVYANNLGGGVPRYVAEAASHEMGHNLGLSHDGLVDGTAYYSGHGSGYTKWAPIMGLGYNGQVTQWSRGDYANANNTQDDIAIIQGHLSPAPDDHGDDSFSASLLAVDAAGNVAATNPQSDPFNFYPDNKGVIDSASDVDVFQIDAGAGDLNLSVRPAWDAYTNNSARGANLDIEVRLSDDTGSTLAVVNPGEDTEAVISANLAAGIYYLSITGVGHGDAATSYDAYSSQGMYFIRGTVPVWSGGNRAPVARNDSASTEENTAVPVAVLANDSDPDGDQLKLVSVGAAGNGQVSISGDQVIYTPAAGFVGSDSFSYLISDTSGEQATGYVSVTVSEKLSPPVAPSGFSVADGQDGTALLTWLDTDNETAYEIYRETSHKKRDAWISSALVATPGADTTSLTDAVGAGAHRYRIRSLNSLGASAWSSWVEVNVTDASGSSGGGKGGGRGNNKR
ncbi:MAG: Ig-like domain-containing protein, partial [Ketobacteraceae bacterium]|nr:Ig-like domain-containing protein [Ketobacteraceae bacterium]